MSALYSHLVEQKAKGLKGFAILLDPDKLDATSLMKIIKMSVECKINYFFVGGSLLTHYNMSTIIRIIKDHSNIPVILFPGSTLQIEPSADAILLLSLISGRNPDYLIGQHVIAAPI